MGRISEIALHCLVNAAWQISVVVIGASICARVLRNAAPRYRHALWVSTLILSLAMPIWTVLRVQPDAPLSNAERSSVALPARENVTSTASPSPSSPVTARPEATHLRPEGLLQTLRRPVVTSSSLALWLALAYALFLVYRFAVLSRAWLQSRGFRRSAYNREIPPLLASVSVRSQAAFGLNHIPLLFSASDGTPATVGGWKPVIILPESLCEATSEETLATVVGHEMAHIARRDYALNLFYEFLFLPISFHPLAVLVKRQIGRTRELACDDMVTERLLEPQAYARSLVRVAGALVLPAGQQLTLGVFDADILEERIMKLTQSTRRIGARAGRLLAVCAFSLLCLTCIAISTFSFDLRTDGTGQPARVVAVNQLVNETRGEAQSPGQSVASAQDPIRTEEARSELAQRLNSANAQVRAEAACLAGKNHALEAIPLLVEMLRDDTPTQPIKCWDEGRWNPALDSFKHPSPGEQAAIALASMGSPALGPLTTALSDSNPSVRRNAAWAIGELTNMRGKERSNAVPGLIVLLDDSDEWVRRAGARALGEIRDERATDGLIAHLSDREWQVRNTAAWALGEMKEEHALEALCRLLQSDAQFEVRKTTAWALAEIQDTRAVETLCNVLRSDTHSEVRAKTAWALGETKDKRAIDSLSNALLTDEEADVRKTAAWALGEIQSRKALAALKQALSDPDERVRTKVMWALSEIEDTDR
jgi:HEAT repeat protein/beta-lactamase regulating signal transducer with metallopeptidase domain